MKGDIKQIVYLANQQEIDFYKEAVHDRGAGYRIKMLKNSKKYKAEMTIYMPEGWYKQDNAISRLFNKGGANSQD